MAKKLEELLKQRKWSGEDAGQLYLYSAINDIIHNRKDEDSAPLFSQEFFNKVVKKLPFMPKEQADFNFYRKLDNAIIEVEQTYRYYDQVFWRYLSTTMLIFKQIDNNYELINKIEKLAISDTEKESLLSNILTVENIFSSNDKFNLDISSKSYEKLKNTLAFFNSVNFIFELLFTHINFEELNSILIDVEEYNKAINELNSKFKKVTEGLKARPLKKIQTYFNEIDVSKFIPLKQQEIVIKRNLNFTENIKETFLERLESICTAFGDALYKAYEG